MTQRMKYVPFLPPPGWDIPINYLESCNLKQTLISISHQLSVLCTDCSCSRVCHHLSDHLSPIIMTRERIGEMTPVS